MQKEAAIIVGIVVAAVAAILWALWSAQKAENRVRDAFFTSCLKDRKDYECMAMWRSGQRGSTTVVPMPIVIPTR